MSLVGEQIFVGLYTTCVYLVCSFFGYSLYPTLFVAGFFKHLIGYYSGIQSLYCSLYDSGKTSRLSLTQIIVDSVYEGLTFFVLYGFILTQLGVSARSVPYVLAFSVHIVAEVLGFHASFIRDKCVY